jgi:hypothetical protein
MERALAFREDGNDTRFYDIDFRAMQADPIGEIHGLYIWLGQPVSDPFEAGMRAWWQQHADGRTQNVHPEPAVFGLDLEVVRSQFAAYTARIPSWTAHEPGKEQRR